MYNVYHSCPLIILFSFNENRLYWDFFYEFIVRIVGYFFPCQYKPGAAVIYTYFTYLSIHERTDHYFLAFLCEGRGFSLWIYQYIHKSEKELLAFIEERDRNQMFELLRFKCRFHVKITKTPETKTFHFFFAHYIFGDKSGPRYIFLLIIQGLRTQGAQGALASY